ncbi:hypothetical protein COLO4_03300 [Corchorus olitorius]|uniref:Uncharacterized protein n=1 Tax=Corchorus olitorius TaxID=93759 RepID=A0A1R3KYZ5_9ROSI|nr:hypothetical protein COLO4_03300 [Corchorus olitorius]
MGLGGRRASRVWSRGLLPSSDCHAGAWYRRRSLPNSPDQLPKIFFITTSPYPTQTSLNRRNGFNYAAGRTPILTRTTLKIPYERAK